MVLHMSIYPLPSPSPSLPPSPTGVQPDIVTVGKPMGNGHPTSAVITTQKIAREFLAKFPDAQKEVNHITCITACMAYEL